MSPQLQGPLSLLGRILLCAIFLASALGDHAPKFNETVDLMTTHGVPVPKIALVGALVFMIAGSLMVIAGWHARYGATMLLVFLILAAAYFHNFWAIDDPGQQQNQMIHFMKNVSMMGAMLFIIANGSGAWSLSSRLDKSASPAA
jgi:putative oxidoreductase